VLFKRGKLKEAAEQLEAAVKNGDAMTDATIHEQLGDVYFQMQDTARARAAWEQAEKAAEKAVPADKRLTEIRKKLKSLKQVGSVLKPSTSDTP
jgi:predicted negative regulator of RcsB-dependent stress response